ncbi:MAG: aminoacetone oxidase family FAD-binding enzyme [Rikenellaceae bacterium]
MYDLIIVGAGAAGLMAAGRAAELGCDVLLLEKMEKPARKIRITGKGRCNITNTRPREEFLEKVRSGKEFIESAWLNFDNRATMLFLSSQGLDITVERGGRVFPSSGKAWDVANTIEYWARDLGVEVRCDSEVESVEVEDGKVKGVRIKGKEALVEGRNVLLTTGGASYPRTGSSGDGYTMAYAVGHTIEPITPALIPLEIDEDLEPYRGLDLKNVGVKLLVDGIPTEERFGEMEFSDKAMGGAIILQISRTAVEAIIDEKRVVVEIDLKPALTDKKLAFRLERDLETLPESAPMRALLDKFTPRPLHRKIVNQISPDLKLRTPIGELNDELKEGFVKVLKHLQFGIKDYRPFDEAIVTAGGVSLDEVNPETMESKKISGLYFAGELLDIDADTGGYNIQLALSTARLAADSIAKK